MLAHQQNVINHVCVLEVKVIDSVVDWSVLECLLVERVESDVVVWTADDCSSFLVCCSELLERIVFKSLLKELVSQEDFIRVPKFLLLVAQA